MSLNYNNFKDIYGDGLEGYVLTYNNESLRDHRIAKELNINFNTYQNIIISCNAIRTSNIEYEDYMFLNEEDIVKAVIALKLIIN